MAAWPGPTGGRLRRGHEAHERAAAGGRGAAARPDRGRATCSAAGRLPPAPPLFALFIFGVAYAGTHTNSGRLERRHAQALSPTMERTEPVPSVIAEAIARSKPSSPDQPLVRALARPVCGRVRTEAEVGGQPGRGVRLVLEDVLERACWSRCRAPWGGRAPARRRCCAAPRRSRRRCACRACRRRTATTRTCPTRRCRPRCAGRGPWPRSRRCGCRLSVSASLAIDISGPGSWPGLDLVQGPLVGELGDLVAGVDVASARRGCTRGPGRGRSGGASRRGG